VREIMSMGGPDAEKRYLTRADGSIFVPLPPEAAGRPQMYWLAEAAVP
jgi:hypothetical protein